MIDHPCVIFALKRERRAFHRHFPIAKHFSDAPCWAALCGSRSQVLALETGVGAQRMQSALDWLFTSHGFKRGQDLLNSEVLSPFEPPRLVLSVGYAGALHDDLQVGDTVLATEVLDGEGNRWSVPWQGHSSSDYRRGRLLTMPYFVATPDEKRALGVKHQARIVDMESAVVARECALRGIPFGCLRTISDAVEPALSPRLVTLLAGGRVPVIRLSLAMLRSPRLVPELMRLARQTRHASHRLGVALRDLLFT